MTTVLYANGEPKMVKYEKIALERAGFQVDTTTQALEAIAASGQRDVIVLDTSLSLAGCTPDIEDYNILLGFPDETNTHHTLLSKALWVHDQIKERATAQQIIMTGTNIPPLFEEYLFSFQTPSLLSPYLPPELIYTINELLG